MSDLQDSENRLLLSCWDGGRGHLTRTLAIGEEAARRGMEVGFVVSDKYALEVGSLAMVSEVFVIPNRKSNVPPPPYDFPVYSHAFRHAQRLRGLGFDDETWLQSITSREIEAIRKFNPGVIVNDYRDTIRTAAQYCGVPVVAITQSTGNIDGRTLGWWSSPPPGVSLPDCRDSFNNVRSSLGLPDIDDEREMFCGDLNLIPSAPSIEPLLEPSPNTHYVGLLSKWVPEQQSFKKIDHDKTDFRVVSYVGEPSRPSYGFEGMLMTVIDREPTAGFYVVGDAASFGSSSVIQRRVDNTVMVEKFIPLPDAIQDSAVALTHGGHGTTLLSLAMGRPVIFVGPYQSEEASTSLGVVDQGAGILLIHSEQELERRQAPDLGSGVEIFGHWQSEITAEKIHAAITRVIEDGAYVANAERIGHELRSLGGVKLAVDHIQELASSR